jgi:predicted phosphoribosyltransferase
MRFRNRKEAGQLLAEALDKYKGQQAVVYALPRGGVELGVEIAKRLKAPLDLIIPRKIGHPAHPEYAICAVTEDGYLVCNQDEIANLDPEWLKIAVLKEQEEAKRRRLRYMAHAADVSAKDKTAIITDDGVATGLTMLAAINEVKDRHPSKIVLAVPVLPRDIARQLEKEVDELVALEIPEDYKGSVGAYYDQFEQLEDQQVIHLLNSLNKGVGKNG